MMTDTDFPGAERGGG